MPRFKPCGVCGEPAHYNPARGGLEVPTHRACRAQLRLKLCSHCGGEFDSYGKFCTKLCADAAARTLPTASCAFCTKEFKARINKSGERSRYCSVSCARKSRAKPPKPAFVPEKRMCADPDCEVWFVAEVTRRRYCGTAPCMSKRSCRAIKQRYKDDPAFRDEVLTRTHSRRVRNLGIPDVTTSKRLIEYLRLRDEGLCGICGGAVPEDDGSPDHVVPLARGGEHSEANLQLSHRACNYRKWATIPAIQNPALSEGTS